ncbi:MAG: alpha-ketoglutarate-dependent dioxygenase AlkB [Deltaproteobacteria bacterium]|nr:alpha-ketoglutarate-dependent dioxygenase AlkB [Deltaproteobacteria bacterium]
MDKLLDELPLVQETIVIAGTRYPTPRLTSWHGDPGATYRYSGRTFEPGPWTPTLAALLARLRAELDPALNACLANYYRDGRDAMGAHADDEPELGPAAPDDVLVASVSLGARRRFVITSKRRAGPDGRLDRIVHELGEGSLFVMGGALQRHYRHHVPRTTRPVGPRLNLTFRIVRAQGAMTSTG